MWHLSSKATLQLCIILMIIIIVITSLNSFNFALRILTAGNFCTVSKAWYTKENKRSKVAIKTLKG